MGLQPPKTRSSVRSVALPRMVVESLDDHLRQWAGCGREGFVFTAPDGGHIEPDNFRSRVWTPAVAAAGLTPLRIHDLRHTTASLAIAAGADVKMLQTMLGHASAVMTLDRYGHLMPGRAWTSPTGSMPSLGRPVWRRFGPPCRWTRGIFAGWTRRGPAPAEAKTGPELAFRWWSSPASIRGPSAFQADALPTELLDRVVCAVLTPSACPR